jgi:hypothetical protein
MVPALGTRGTVAAVGVLFIVWAPVLPRWIGGVPVIRPIFVEGARAEEWPRAIRWGAAEEPVEVLRAWMEEREGDRRRCFRIRLRDGSVLDIGRPEPDGVWSIDRERDEAG